MAAPILNEELRKTVNNCKTLVVGAGGIGCELIKNLVLTGFEDLVIVSNAVVHSVYLSFNFYIMYFNYCTYCML